MVEKEMIENNADPGDHIRVLYEKQGNKEVEGILMPRPEMLGDDVLVLKLESGYNIGINKDKIKEIKVLKKHEIKEIKVKKPAYDPNLPNVSILSLGGTISSKVDYKTGGTSADYTADDFVQMIPELKGIANIEAKKVLSIMSEDADSKDWGDIAKAIYDEAKRDDIKGIVATVGTDTMHYITAAVSFLLDGLDKPVIFTASQRSIDRGSSDAFMNLLCSVKTAAEFDGAVVATCMHGSTNDDYCILCRGTKVRKMHTSRRDAFRPINEKPFAKVYPDKDIEIINDNYPKIGGFADVHSGKLRYDSKFEDKVALVFVHPGIDKDIIDYYVNKGYKGIVLSATALGHVPTNDKISLLPGIKRAIDNGVVIVIASQTIYGSTHPYVYSNLRKLSIGAGCLFAGDMLAETAFIKLGYVLGHAKNIDEVKEMFSQNLRGEFNKRHLADDFLI